MIEKMIFMKCKQGVQNERTEAENRICLLQLRRDKPPLDGPLPQLRQLEHHE